MKGIMIAAIKSGSGKTTITCGLLEAIKQRGHAVTAFKCGPDYIDPMFHRKVIGVASHNLDTFFSDDEQIRELYAKEGADNEIAVIEGVMGLFDGLGGIRQEGSSYHLAKVLQIPIILVIDAHGMGRTVVPVLAGIKDYDEANLIKGVVLNNTSEAFAKTIAGIIEEEVKIPVVGYVPKLRDIKIESRYLGLRLPEEIEGIKEQLAEFAGQLEQTVNVDKLLEIAESVDKVGVSNRGSQCDNQSSANKYNQSSTNKYNQGSANKYNQGSPNKYNQSSANKYNQSSANKYNQSSPDNDTKIRIAVAMDEAFNFYYDENLQMLKEYGAELVYFSPIHDRCLPDSINGILLGGGYPELKAEELSSNISMRESIKKAIQSNIPSIAECGGFMYLHDSIRLEDGSVYPMVGVINAESSYAGKLVRFGYVEINEKRSLFLKEDRCIKGHEFHYFDSTDNGKDAVATKPVTGKNWECVHAGVNHWWGYPHLYYPSNPDFVEHFINVCSKVKTT